MKLRPNRFRRYRAPIAVLAVLTSLWLPGQAGAEESHKATYHLKGQSAAVELSAEPAPLVTGSADFTVRLTDSKTGEPITGAMVMLTAHPPESVETRGHAPEGDSGHNPAGSAAHGPHIDQTVTLHEARPEQEMAGGHGGEQHSAGSGQHSAGGTAGGNSQGFYGGSIKISEPGVWTIEVTVETGGRHETLTLDLPVENSGPNIVFLGITGGLMLTAIFTSVVLKLAGKGGSRDDA